MFETKNDIGTNMDYFNPIIGFASAVRIAPQAYQHSEHTQWKIYRHFARRD
jgi:hypothetical protein